jgi:hypothetical protein
MTSNENSKQDKWEHVRESLWGAPGFQRKNKTITTEGWSFLPMASWIVETIKTNDSVAIFLQVIDKDGGQRIVPQKVCEAIYSQEYRIKRKRRSEGGKKGAETRKALGIIPFQRKEQKE